MNVMAKDSEEFAGFGRYAGPATLILASLADGAKHGYALTKDIESFAGVRLAPGTLAVACVVAGAATTVRRIELSRAILGFEVRLGIAACVTMAVFLGGCCAWIIDRTPGPGSLFHPGAIDVAGAAVMAVAVARQATRRARAAAG